MPSPSKTKTATSANTTPRGAIEALSQADAAWLISEHTSWLRDHPHLDGRSADGTYSGRDLVRAIRCDYQAAELPDGDLEPCRQLAENLMWSIEPARPAAQLLDSIRQRYGAAGLAAFAEELLTACTNRAKSDPPPRPVLSPEQIRAAAIASAEREIADLEFKAARDAGRTVLLCDCGRYRWGRSWLTGRIPTGFAPIRDEACPNAKCQAKAKAEF